MSNLTKRLDDLEAELIPPPRPPIYTWHGGNSNERPDFYNEYDWLYANCAGREVYICAGAKGALPLELQEPNIKP